jgi:putative transposase
MIRTFKYPLKPTKAQAGVLESWLVSLQRLYNGALEERRGAWEKGVFVDLNNQYKSLTQIRAALPEYAQLPARVARSALWRLDRAFKDFFRRVRDGGEPPGYPRFRAKERYRSFSFPHPRITDSNVHIPSFGPVKFNRYRDPRGDIVEARVVRGVRGWELFLVCDLGDAPPKVPVRTAIGVDLGLQHFLTLSNGATAENPRFFARAEAEISKKQRAVSTKEAGSNRRAKAKCALATAYRKVKRQRLDFCRKLAKEVVEQYDLVAHEDLEIARMRRDKGFGYNISDAAWGVFLDCLSCKAEEAGKTVVAVDPRGTSQQCSGCGEQVLKGLLVRIHRCARCGLVLDRDENAARNIIERGRRSAGLPAEAQS